MSHDVELPGGGTIHLQSADEVDRWNTLDTAYRTDYPLTKINDLTTLGSILTQHVIIYRAQRALSGVEDEFDDEGLPTGMTVRKELKPAQIKAHQESINSANKEIREMERLLGIDKRSREAGGKDTIQDYLQRVKKLGREYGIHVNDRTKAYEEFVNEMRWRIRLLEVGDSEDRAYHDCTPEGILKWAKEMLELLESKDQDWAQQVGKLYVGRV